MNNIGNNISFTGKFSLNKAELSKISLLQKAKFLKQKDQIINEFSNSKDAFVKQGDFFIVDIKDNKEDKFLKFAKSFNLNFTKISG